MWILITVAFFLSTGNSGGSLGVSQVQSVEFSSKESCESAAKKLNDIKGRQVVTSNWNTLSPEAIGHPLQAFCVAKE